MNGKCVWCGEWDITDTHECSDKHIKMFNGFSSMKSDQRVTFLNDLSIHFCLKCGKSTDCRCEDD